MKFGYTVIYVENVVETIEFYEKAFGLTRKFIHEGKDYAELNTGGTILAFASWQIFSNMEKADAGTIALHANRKTDPTNGFDICFVTEDVTLAFEHAINSGATLVSAPTLKPWGQTVGFLRDLNGCLVEIATPISTS